MSTPSKQEQLPLSNDGLRHYEIIRPEFRYVEPHAAYRSFDQNLLAAGPWPPPSLTSHLGDVGLEFLIGGLPVAVCVRSKNRIISQYRIISGLRTWNAARHAHIGLPVIIVHGISSAQCRNAVAWDIACAIGLQRGSDSARHAIEACTQLRRDRPELAGWMPRKNTLCEWYGLTPDQVRPAPSEHSGDSSDPETLRLDLEIADDHS